jgi:hypothetical protein
MSPDAKNKTIHLVIGITMLLVVFFAEDSYANPFCHSFLLATLCDVSTNYYKNNARTFFDLIQGAVDHQKK